MMQIVLHFKSLMHIPMSNPLKNVYDDTRKLTKLGTMQHDAMHE